MGKNVIRIPHSPYLFRYLCLRSVEVFVVRRGRISGPIPSCSSLFPSPSRWVWGDRGDTWVAAEAGGTWLSAVGAFSAPCGARGAGVVGRKTCWIEERS